MDAAFEERSLPAAIRLIKIGNAGVPSPAIVAGEDDKRVVLKAAALQLLQNVADPSVELADHRTVDALGVVFDLRQGIVI